MKSLKHIKSCWVSRSRSQVKPWGSELVWKAHNSVGGKILHIRESERTSLKYNTPVSYTHLTLPTNREV